MIDKEMQNRCALIVVKENNKLFACLVVMEECV